MLLREVSNMQPDYMKMAQGQAAPKEQAAPQKADELNKFYEEQGMAQGNDVESIKQRLLQVLEDSGFLKKLTPEGLKTLTNKVQEFAELAVKGDQEALKNHPITKLLGQIEKQAAAQSQQQPQQPQQQPQGAAPKNFAGMMPPGGGMSGR